MPEPSTNQIREALKFSQFRFKLIEFLKLPFDIGEPALREVLERSNHPPAEPGAFENVSRSKRLSGVANAAPNLSGHL